MYLFVRQYHKDTDRLALWLRGVVVVGPIVGAFLSFNTIQSLHHNYEALTAQQRSLAEQNKSLAHDVQFGKAVAAMQMGGGL